MAWNRKENIMKEITKITITTEDNEVIASIDFEEANAILIDNVKCSIEYNDGEVEEIKK